MATHKVRAGTKYIFYANLLDFEHRDLNGRVGVVINLHGCPPANTMGHAYFQVDGDEFPSGVLQLTLQDVRAQTRYRRPDSGCRKAQNSNGGSLMARERIIRAAMAAKAVGLNVTAILLLEAVAKQEGR